MGFFNRPVETMPREHLQAYQLEKLQQMLSQIYGRNRFYTAKLTAAGATPHDIQSLADFYQLPFTTKQERIGALLVSGGGHNSLQRLHIMRDLQVMAMCCTPTYALRQSLSEGDDRPFLECGSGLSRSETALRLQ